MLSRVADNAFWLSRYVERAENIARIVDVNLQLILDLPARRAGDAAEHWPRVVACLGDDGEFRKRKLKPEAEIVTDFLLFDRTNANSIASCLAFARENARTIRELITAEMWEQINRTHLWLASRSAHQFYSKNAYDFFQRLKKSLQLFQGITDSVMHRGEGWEFIQLGRYLERADKTSRILDDKFFLRSATRKGVPDVLPQWTSILRSCNARQTYLRLYASGVDPRRVSELLTLNAAFPRSVLFCVLHVDQALRRISGVPVGQFTNLAEKLSGRLLSELSFSTLDDIWDKGLHKAMDELQVQLNDIGAAILETYIHPSAPPVITSPVQLMAVPQ
jgi:uncharacterized alpha-E superfamily protein